MKKVISVLLIVVMFFGVMPLSGIDLSIKSSALASNGKCGENVTYTFDSSIGLLTISGSGCMNDYDGDFIFSPFYKLASIKTVNIENGVTSIGEWAFEGCSSLTSITISDSVTSIGKLAFDGCKSLTSVTIGNSVMSIGTSAFRYCSSLTSITIPDSVTSIGGSAFDNCRSLISVTIPDSVTSIGGRAFYMCTGLTSITIPNSVTSIGSSAFYNTKYYNTESNWDNKVLYIGKYLIDAEMDISGSYSIKNGTKIIIDSAFNSCSSLTSVTIPNSVSSIGNYAFYDCTSLTSITIPDSVTSIGNYAFSDCTSLTSITIPDSITSIGSFAFSSCTSLTKVNITDIAAWCNIEFNDYTSMDDMDSGSNPLFYAHNLYLNDELVTDLVIPEGVNKINHYAFFECTSLVSVTIPDTITSIGFYAFNGCTNLKKVKITDIAAWCNIDFRDDYCCDYDYYGSNPLYYAHNLYLNNELVTDLTIPDVVTSISSYAFYKCTCLTSVTLPDSVTDVGEGTFFCCTGIKELEIPCSTKMSFDIYGLVTPSSLDGCSNIEKITFSKGTGTMYDYSRSGFFTLQNLKEIILEDGIESISSYAFCGCNGLTDVTIPSSVSAINYFAFAECDNLKTIYYNAQNAKVSSAFDDSVENVIIGDSVETIPAGFLKNCSGIKSIVIPENVKAIGNDAFNSCDNLETVTFIGDNRFEFGSNIFLYCNKLNIVCQENSFVHNYAIVNGLDYTICDENENTFNIKNDILMGYNGEAKDLFISCASKVGFGSFENNNDIVNIELSSSVVRIFNKAFSNCSSLEKIIIPQSVASIGDNAFEGCDNLTIWCYAGSYAETYAVNHDIPVHYITLEMSKNEIQLDANESINLCASFNTDLTEEVELIWTSDNPDVVTVTPDGKITAVGTGKATITATSSTGLYASCVVNVSMGGSQEKITSVTVEDVSMKYKGTSTIKPQVDNKDVKYTVEYSTSNPSVATVDDNGNITTHNKGTATITCTVTDEYGNVVTDTCNVNVTFSFGQWLIWILLLGFLWY